MEGETEEIERVPGRRNQGSAKGKSEYRSMQRKAYAMKLKDLAGQAGVSAATVSIVRQGKPGVSAALQEPAAAGDRHPRDA